MAEPSAMPVSVSVIDHHGVLNFCLGPRMDGSTRYVRDDIHKLVVNRYEELKKINKELRKEVTNLAQESVARSVELAKLEAEVMRLRELLTPRPIDEAPKDGTWFFVLHCVQVTGNRHPVWTVCQWYAEQRPGRSSQYDGWHDDAGLPINPGPFWLPMPPAPEVSK